MKRRLAWNCALLIAGATLTLLVGACARPAAEPAMPNTNADVAKVAAPTSATPAPAAAASAAAGPAAPEPAPNAQAAVVVDVWHDTVCPWCRIGIANVEAAAKRTGVPIELRLHPFQLDPSTPPEGRDLRAWLAQKYGAQQVGSMFERVTAIGAQAGVHFDFSKVTRGPQTLASHVTIAAAPAALRNAFVHAVHVAYFENGEDIGDVEVLARLADQVGWSAAEARDAAMDRNRRDEVAAAARQASARGISGVPYVVIGGRALNGAQPVETFAQAIRAGSLAQPR